ncbi:phosphoglycolate phosphatase [Pseudoalteromonas phenolica]|uniref:phosphoglycolate phosphatase n=1 Tax=Pseudoalteromonas phenolica TaxID=161398 RepID=A0A5R9Q6B0_9GAMM|nr:HAD family hydrolase [Pseudoalteromonas phenolica]TLX48680.1 phosphoglycolate phosphatase [Pseudoalteromonas phenolica]
MKYQGVLFDLDGTLVDSAQDMYMALNLTLTEVAFPVVSYAQVTTWVGNGIEMLVKRALSGDMAVNPELPPQLVVDAVARFKNHYQQLAGDYVALYQHVETGLAATAHLPKAIVTNKDRVFTEQLLEKLNLTSHFKVLVCGDDGEKKPSPSPLLKACEALNISPEKAIMIGDSKSDVIAAKSAEIDVLALTYGYNQGFDLKELEPEYLCDGFLDIIPIINQQ